MNRTLRLSTAPQDNAMVCQVTWLTEPLTSVEVDPEEEVEAAGAEVDHVAGLEEVDVAGAVVVGVVDVEPVDEAAEEAADEAAEEATVEAAEEAADEAVDPDVEDDDEAEDDVVVVSSAQIQSMSYLSSHVTDGFWQLRATTVSSPTPRPHNFVVETSQPSSLVK